MSVATTTRPRAGHVDRRWWALALLAMAEFVVVLDASIVNIALPSIGRGLHFSLAGLSWVVNAYVLTFGGFLLLGGRIADLVGRRRVFMIGLGVFALASLAGGLAQSPAWLIGARAVQGLGAALMAPAALSLVTATFREGSERNRALSVWGAVAGSGAAAGVLLGGVLTSALGWRSVLFVNVPIAIVAALLTPSLIAESRGEFDRRGFDLPGAVTVTAGLSALVYGLVRTSSVGWSSPQTVGALGRRCPFARRIRRDRATLERPPRPVRVLPQPRRPRRERDHVGHGSRRHRPVLLPLALPAGGARLQRHQGRHLAAAPGGRGHPRRRDRIPAGRPRRRKNGAHPPGSSSSPAASSGSPSCPCTAPTSLTCSAPPCSSPLD
jgi:Major Facilitator Superfamily